MRLFIGLYLPDHVLAHLDGHRMLPPQLSGLKWTPVRSLHVTLKFIGHTEKENISIYQSVLKDVASRYSPFKLWCESGGVFPSSARPRVFWTGLQGDLNRLAQLARDLEDEFGRLGCPPENRRFSPHLTVARVDKGFHSVEEFENKYARYLSPEFLVSEIHLIESHLGAHGSTYQKLASFPLSMESEIRQPSSSPTP